jgi:hypothetical protein
MFAQATADAMGNGITSSNIIIRSFTTLQLLNQASSNHDNLFASTATTISVLVKYNVSIVNAAVLGFSTPQAAYNALTSSLDNAVGNGQYTSSMGSIAVSLGATAFYQATTEEIPVIGPLTYSPGQPTPSPIFTSSSDSTSEWGVDGVYLWVTISVILFAVLLSVIFIWYKYFRVSPSAASSYADVENSIIYPVSSKTFQINPMKRKSVEMNLVIDNSKTII